MTVISLSVVIDERPYVFAAGLDAVAGGDPRQDLTHRGSGRFLLGRLPDELGAAPVIVSAIGTC
ncbi:MAG: hypothetical protein WBG36_17275 [Ornithinimicrobium sp.]